MPTVRALARLVWSLGRIAWGIASWLARDVRDDAVEHYRGASDWERATIIGLAVGGVVSALGVFLLRFL